ncbi:MAG: hypothetical protein CMH56_17110 [Myxococcales bacterium]|nr:hypothetical protein [Myxococcales bacterium]
MDEVTQVSPPRSEQEIETLHRRLKASSVFTILQLQPTYDLSEIHASLQSLKKEVLACIATLPESHPYRLSFPGRLNEIHDFINQPLQRFILNQAQSMGVDLSDIAARNILESKFLDERVPTLLDSEKYEEALPLAERMVSLSPEDTHSQAALYTARVFCSGSVEVQKESITGLMKIAEDAPASLDLQVYTARASLHVNRKEQAKGAVVRAEQINAKDPRVMALREQLSRKTVSPKKDAPGKATPGPRPSVVRGDKDISKAIKIGVGSLLVILLTWVLAIPMGMASTEPQYEITNAFWLIRRFLLIGAAFIFYYFIYEKNPQEMADDIGLTLPPMATPVAIVLGIFLGLASDFVPTGNTSLNVLGAFIHAAAYAIFFWGLLNHCFSRATGHGFAGVVITSLLVGLYHFSFPTIVGLEGVWMTLWIGQYMIFMGVIPGLLWDRGGQTVIPPFAYCLTINLLIVFKSAL